MTTMTTHLYARTLVLLLLCFLGLAPQAQAQLDLTVGGPINSPISVVAGQNYDLGATILSTGPAQFGYIGVYLSRDNAWDGADTYLNAVGNNIIMPPHSARLTINVTIPQATAAGNYYLVFVADPLNMEREVNEQNNVVAVPVSVTAGSPAQLADLVLWRPSITFNSLPAGGSLGAFTFITNYGAGGAANVEVGYYLSVDTLLTPGDVILGTSSAGSFSANSGTITSNPVLRVPASTAPGRYFLLIVADHLNRIAESNENNNSRALAITVTGGVTALNAAAGAAALAVYPNPVNQGEQLHLRYDGRRLGAQPVVTLLNALGQVVARPALLPGVGDTGHLELSGLVPGLYTVQVVDGQYRGQQRVLVK